MTTMIQRMLRHQGQQSARACFTSSMQALAVYRKLWSNAPEGLDVDSLNGILWWAL